ncbi:MAG: class I SAM-dependent methyltransferase [Anaerolineae bacterium]
MTKADSTHTRAPEQLEEDRHWWFASRTRALLGMMDRVLPGRNLKLLDIGCGAGNMIHHLSRYGQVKGVEIDPRPVAVAHQRGYDVDQGDATQGLAYEEASFDVVTALDVIEHNQDDLSILREMYRVLKPGGHAVITVPAFMWLWSHNDDINAHVRRYTARELRDRLEAIGFRVRRMTYNNFFVFPMAAALILARRNRGSQPELASHHLSEDEYQVEMEPASPPVNVVLTGVGWVEAQLLRWVSLPVGTSIIAIAEKA